jgi:hypothetical protein
MIDNVSGPNGPTTPEVRPAGIESEPNGGDPAPNGGDPAPNDDPVFGSSNLERYKTVSCELMPRHRQLVAAINATLPSENAMARHLFSVEMIGSALNLLDPQQRWKPLADLLVTMAGIDAEALCALLPAPIRGSFEDVAQELGWMRKTDGEEGSDEI